MFNKETLGDLTETILYVNLLLAILALIALYDQRTVNKEEDNKNKAWEESVDEELAQLQRRLAVIEQCLMLESKNN